MKVLNQAKVLIGELKNTSSSLEKKEILKKHLIGNEDLKKLVHYTYNPLYQFYVTSDVCEKNSRLNGKEFKCIFELLDTLRTRKLTGHDAVGAVNNFVSNNIDHKEIIYNVIDKDLKTRTAEKTINSAIKNLIPEFDVALADKYEDKNVNFKDNWYASHKLDGVRCVCVVDENGKVTSFSRQGKIFSTLSKVEEEISKLGVKNIVFDGELCAIEDGKEDFQAIMKLIRRKDYTIPNPAYKLFDVVDLQDFFNKKSKEVFSERNKRLKSILEDYEKKYEKGVKLRSFDEHKAHLSILEQTLVKDKNHLSSLLKDAAINEWEGIMLRKDCAYEGKRSKNLLKCKSFSDGEYEILETENGPFRLVVDGKEVEEEMLSCVTIMHKGYPVRVGSGWSVEQRRKFYKNPEEIIGKTLTVQYFQESFNEKGEISLRFPTVKFVHGEERDT
jgi:DNA ligase-1